MQQFHYTSHVIKTEPLPSPHQVNQRLKCLQFCHIEQQHRCYEAHALYDSETVSSTFGTSHRGIAIHVYIPERIQRQGGNMKMLEGHCTAPSSLDRLGDNNESYEKLRAVRTGTQHRRTVMEKTQGREGSWNIMLDECHGVKLVGVAGGSDLWSELGAGGPVVILRCYHGAKPLGASPTPTLRVQRIITDIFPTCQCRCTYATIQQYFLLLLLLSVLLFLRWWRGKSWEESRKSRLFNVVAVTNIPPQKG